MFAEFVHLSVEDHKQQPADLRSQPSCNRFIVTLKREHF